MNRYKKLWKNIGTMAVGSFAAKIISFFLILLYTSVLSTDEYGLSDLIVVSFSLIFPIFSAEIRSGMMRFALDGEKCHQKVFKSGFTITLIGIAVTLAVSPVVLIFPNIRQYYFLIVVYYIFYAFQSNLSYFCRGIEKVATFTIGGIVCSFALLISNLLFLLVFRLGLVGYLLSYALAYAVSFFYMAFKIHIHKYFTKGDWFNKPLTTQMLKYSIPIVPSSIGWWLNNSCDKYILAACFSTSVCGVYAVAYKIPSVLTMITSVFYGAWSISSVEDFHSDETRHFFSNVYAKYISGYALLSSFIILFVKPISRILYAKAFYEAWRFVPVLIFGFVFYSAASFLTSIYTAAKKTNMIMVSTVIGAVVNILLNIIVIPHYGAMGAAITTTISYIVIWLIRLIDTKRILKLDINFAKHFVFYALLLAQIVITCLDIKYSYIFSFVIFCLITILSRDILKSLIMKLKQFKDSHRRTI